MENTSSKITEDPVLLSWELANSRRYLFILVSAASVVPVVLLGALVVKHLPTNPVLRLLSCYLFAAFLGVITSLFLPPLLHASRKLRCTASGMVIKTVLGLWSTLSWGEILKLRPGRYGFAVLESKGSFKRLYLPIGPDVRDKLIAILRETSNARIVGFGPEGS